MTRCSQSGQCRAVTCYLHRQHPGYRTTAARPARRLLTMSSTRQRWTAIRPWMTRRPTPGGQMSQPCIRKSSPKPIPTSSCPRGHPKAGHFLRSRPLFTGRVLPGPMRTGLLALAALCRAMVLSQTATYRRGTSTTPQPLDSGWTPMTTRISPATTQAMRLSARMVAKRSKQPVCNLAAADSAQPTKPPRMILCTSWPLSPGITPLIILCTRAPTSKTDSVRQQPTRL